MKNINKIGSLDEGTNKAGIINKTISKQMMVRNINSHHSPFGQF